MLTVHLVNRRHYRVLALHGFRMEFGMLLAEVLLEFRVEAEAKGAFGTLKRFHPFIVALRREPRYSPAISARRSPMSGANLKPCPLHGDPTTMFPWRSRMNLWSSVFV